MKNDNEISLNFRLV